MLNPDVTIVGGGPAGAVTGRILAEKGYQVVIFEKSRFPRDKVCGCCLNETAIQLLLPKHSLVKDYFPPHLPQKSFELLYNGKSHSMPIPGGIIISRSELDSFLIDKARSAGCIVYEGVKAHVRWPQAEVYGDNVPELKTKILCLASGLDPKNIQVDFFGRSKVNSNKNGNAKIGLGAKSSGEIIPYDLEEGVVRMHLTNAGYLGETLLTDGTVVYGAAIRRDVLGNGDSLAKTMSSMFSLPHLALLEWTGTPILDSIPESVAEARCLRIGDAAGYVEPFTGQGMSWAIQSGILAAELIDEELQSADSLVESGRLSRRWKKILNRKLIFSRHFCKFASILASNPSFGYPLIASPCFPEKVVLRLLYGYGPFSVMNR